MTEAVKKICSIIFSLGVQLCTAITSCGEDVCGGPCRMGFIVLDLPYRVSNWFSAKCRLHTCSLQAQVWYCVWHRGIKTQRLKMGMLITSHDVGDPQKRKARLRLLETTEWGPFQVNQTVLSLLFSYTDCLSALKKVDGIHGFFAGSVLQ